MEELQREFPNQINLRWRSYELRPAGSPPIPPAYLATIPEKRKYFAQRLKAEHGFDIHEGPFGINSRPALILEKYAEAHGKSAEYRHYVDRAYWTQAQDISKPEVLADILKTIGLETPDLNAVLQNPRYDDAVTADVMQAYQYGLQGVPAVVFQNRYLVSGAQPYPVFRQVTQRVLAEIENGTL